MYWIAELLTAYPAEYTAILGTSLCCIGCVIWMLKRTANPGQPTLLVAMGLGLLPWFLGNIVSFPLMSDMLSQYRFDPLEHSYALYRGIYGGANLKWSGLFYSGLIQYGISLWLLKRAHLGIRIPKRTVALTGVAAVAIFGIVIYLENQQMAHT